MTNAVLFDNPLTNAIPINPSERMKLVVVSGWEDSNQTVSPPDSETNQP